MDVPGPVLPSGQFSLGKVCVVGGSGLVIKYFSSYFHIWLMFAYPTLKPRFPKMSPSLLAIGAKKKTRKDILP